MGDHNYNNQVNPFQSQNPQPVWKKSKAVVITIIVVIIAIAVAAGAIVFKIVSENADESEREKKPYTGGDYVVKSKLAAANSTAACVYDVVNTVLAEFEEQEIDIADLEYISYSKGDDAVDITGNVRGIDGEKIYVNIKKYFNDVEKCDFVVKIDHGVCAAAISTTDNEYWGTKPIVFKGDDYQNADSVFTLEDVFKRFDDFTHEHGSEFSFSDYR